jgi:polysaccharide export outer membrane protein
MNPVNPNRRPSTRRRPAALIPAVLELFFAAIVALSPAAAFADPVAAMAAQENVLPAASAPPSAASASPATAPGAMSAPASEAAPTAGKDEEPVLKLGVGDSVSIQVYGRPELTTTTYVSDDGTIAAPLAGVVHVAGLSPADAAQRVATAYRDGQILVNPQVTISLVQYRSQQVSVLGEVRTPGRYSIESKTTIFDLIAQAGGINETGAEVVYLLRRDGSGNVTRIPVDLKGLSDPTKPVPMLAIRGGDSVFVPRAEQFYIYGEVQKPDMYRLEPSMTVMQAISRSGGITQRGSDGRVQIKRRRADGKYATFDARLTDPVQPNDVIYVKERIF